MPPVIAERRAQVPSNASNNEATQSTDPLDGVRGTRLHVFISDRILTDQIQRILSALKFTNVTVQKASANYLENARQLVKILIQEQGLVLTGPPLELRDARGGVVSQKNIKDFFINVQTLLQKCHKDDTRFLHRCIPIFQDISFLQKRESIILGLAPFGIATAFILKKQDSLMGLHPSRRQALLQEQLMERFQEMRAYLEEFLPNMEGALEKTLEKKEEMELSLRKEESDQWLAKAEEFKRAQDFNQAVQCYHRAIELFPANPQLYLESGRTYVRLRKYPLAFQRFRQAEEVSAAMPLPNMEIGVLRMTQVREMVDEGAAPDSPEVMSLLEEAVGSFQTAFTKASKIPELAQTDGKPRNRSQEALMDIAGEIFKLDTETLLGKNHPAVIALRTEARGALGKVKGVATEDLPPDRWSAWGWPPWTRGTTKRRSDCCSKPPRTRTRFPRPVRS